jgi:hypothetical protein
MICSDCKGPIEPGPLGEPYAVTITTTVHRTVHDPVLRDGLATSLSETRETLCIPCAKLLGLSNPLAGLF